MNWTAIKETLIGAALTAVTLLGISASYLCVTTGMTIHTNGLHSAKLIMDADDVTVQGTLALKTLNAKKTGTLAQLDQALTDVRRVVSHSDRLMTKQEQSVDQWNAQITTTLGNVNTAVVAATTSENEITKSSVETLSATTATIESVKPLVVQLNTEVDALHTATIGITAMLPDVQATAKNVSGITLHLDGTVSDFGRVTKKFADDYTKPVKWYMWPLKQYNDLMDIGAAAARFSR